MGGKQAIAMFAAAMRVVWQKSKKDNFHFQNNHPKGRKTTSSHLNGHADSTSHLIATLQMLNSF